MTYHFSFLIVILDEEMSCIAFETDAAVINLTLINQDIVILIILQYSLQFITISKSCIYSIRALNISSKVE